MLGQALNHHGGHGLVGAEVRPGPAAQVCAQIVRLVHTLGPLRIAGVREDEGEGNHGFSCTLESVHSGTNNTPHLLAYCSENLRMASRFLLGTSASAGEASFFSVGGRRRAYSATLDLKIDTGRPREHFTCVFSSCLDWGNHCVSPAAVSQGPASWESLASYAPRARGHRLRAICDHHFNYYLSI